MKKKIGIIGAAGFVGVELVKQLQNFTNFEIIAITRANGQFILKDYNLTLINPKDLSNSEKVDILINLAYPSHFYLYPEENKKILTQIVDITHKHSIIIHISTQAVFGFDLDKQIALKQLNNRRDVPYVESKIMMENLICKKFKKHKIHIIRLGNVWGAGSGTWTAEMVHRLLFAQPVKVKGSDGYSNITDVKNIASYIIHLLNSVNTDIKIEFHHLAEFSYVRWSEWITVLEDYLKIKSVASERIISPSESIWSELVLPFSNFKPNALFKNFIGTRFLSSYIRTLVRLIGYDNYVKFKNKKVTLLSSNNTIGQLDFLYLKIFSCGTEFKNSTQVEWQPVVSFEESCLNVKKWMREVGYLSE